MKIRIPGWFRLSPLTRSVLLLCSAVCFLAFFDSLDFNIQRQRKVLAKADGVITKFLEGDTDQRIDSEETGDWYSLFRRINELAVILSAQAEHEKQTCMVRLVIV